MLYKNIWRHTCHHISQKTASHSCDRSEKHKQKCIIHMSLTDSRIYSYYCKNPQSHRVQHQHKFVIGFSSVSLQKLSFEIKNKEHNTGSKHRYQCIHRISEYSRRYHSQNNIPDHSSSHCCCHSQNTDAKNIHIALYSHHCSGSCKRHCSCHFHNKCCN